MRKKLFFILFLFVLTITISQDNFQLRTVAESELVTIIPRSSAVSMPIHINGNLGWEDFKDAGNCTGQGTYSDPYIIENLEIDGGGSENGILIKNSDVYFRIENVEIKNFNEQLNNSSNDRDISNGGSIGVQLLNISNGKFINNDFSDNFIGISLKGYNNIISGNTIRNSEYTAIFITGGNNNIISGNIIDDNNHYGIYLSSSHNNTISDNTIKDNRGDYGGTGVYFDQSHNNTFSRNKVYNNYFGIAVLSGRNNTFSNNTIDNNVGYGIYLRGGTNWNSIYLNCFNNPINVNAVNHLNNSWDNGTKGNFWGNYNGTDTDGDGIGDTPYNITDAEGFTVNQDNFPLMECDLPSQEGYSIPGYDSFFIIGIIGIMTIILLNQLKKRSRN